MPLPNYIKYLKTNSSLYFLFCFLLHSTYKKAEQKERNEKGNIFIKKLFLTCRKNVRKQKSFYKITRQYNLKIQIFGVTFFRFSYILQIYFFMFRKVDGVYTGEDTTNIKVLYVDSIVES